jgi:hypothetical protein
MFKINLNQILVAATNYNLVYKKNRQLFSGLISDFCIFPIIIQLAQLE